MLALGSVDKRLVVFSPQPLQRCKGCPLHRGRQPSWSWLAKSSGRPYPSRMLLVLEKVRREKMCLKSCVRSENTRLLWPGTASTGIFCLWALAAAQIFWWGLWCFHEDWVELRLSCRRWFMIPKNRLRAILLCQSNLSRLLCHPLVSYCIFCL